MKLLNSDGLCSFCVSPRLDSSEEANEGDRETRAYMQTYTPATNVYIYVCMQNTYMSDSSLPGSSVRGILQASIMDPGLLHYRQIFTI